MLAKLAGAQECSDAALAAAAASSGPAEQQNPSCPAGSRVGTVDTAAGPCSDPVHIPGSLYLTRPYTGAPYGLAVVVPAVAGPYDLGTVVVRQALYIDPTTAQVMDMSDPFPTILDGIPLRLQGVTVTLDRSGFTCQPDLVRPDECDRHAHFDRRAVRSGQLALPGRRLLVFGLLAQLKIALSGKGKARSGDHPTLTATLTDPPGQANIHTANVTLPLSMALDRTTASTGATTRPRRPCTADRSHVVQAR